MARGEGLNRGFVESGHFPNPSGENIREITSEFIEFFFVYLDELGPVIILPFSLDPSPDGDFSLTGLH